MVGLGFSFLRCTNLLPPSCFLASNFFFFTVLSSINLCPWSLYPFKKTMRTTTKILYYHFNEFSKGIGLNACLICCLCLEAYFLYFSHSIPSLPPSFSFSFLSLILSFLHPVDPVVYYFRHFPSYPHSFSFSFICPHNPLLSILSTPTSFLLVFRKNIMQCYKLAPL